MSISIKEYFALAGSSFTNDDAKIIGPVLSELQKEGFVTPEEVVRAAHSENSPLRSYFEWDDAKAAGYYREGQARDMLRSIRVRFVSDEREFATRAHKIEVAPRPSSLSNAVTIARDKDDDIHPLAAAMLRDLDAWCVKYAPYTASFGKFAEVFNVVRTQIEEFREDFESGHLSGPFRRMMTEFFQWHEQWLHHIGAARLYGEHARYMQEAVVEAKEAFADLGLTDKRESDAA